MGRRDFIKKFGLGAAGIIGTGAALKTWGKIAGKMTGKKAKAVGTGDIQMAVGKGKPQNMMPGLVPGDKINPIWDASPFTVQGMPAIFVSPDQIPDDYMIPGRNIPAKGYREQLLKQYGKADLQTLRKRIESTGTWATNDYGFDYYPGPHWPDDVEVPAADFGRWTDSRRWLPHAPARLVSCFGIIPIKSISTTTNGRTPQHGCRSARRNNAKAWILR